MKQLKKYAAIGGAIAIAACWPFATGKIGQSIITDAIAHYENPVISIELVDYDRGYLRSTAVSKISIKDPVIAEQFKADGFPEELIFNHEINHGILTIDSISRLEVPPELETFLADMDIKFESSSQLTGSTHIQLTSKAKSIQLPAELESGVERIDLSRFTFDADIDRDGLNGFSYHLPTLDFVTILGEKLNLTGFSGEGKGNSNGAFWVGTNDVYLKEASITSGSDISVLKGLSYKNATSLSEESNPGSDDQKVSSTNIFKLGLMESDQDKVENARLSVTFSALDYSALKKVFVSYNELQEQQAQSTISELELAINLLVAKGMTLSIDDFGATLMGGEFSSKLNLMLPAGTARASQDATQLVENLRGSSSVVISKSLAESNPMVQMMIEEKLQDGVIVDSGEQYEFTTEIKDGSATLANGEQVPLFMVLTPFL
ncbi:MAG: DUF945 family protein [Aliivibrio sp.]|uniref:DUF945 family protein n=1 Tax=Aliivibrio sp. TaxID=1872443 RepID=UPI001A3FC716|nr:DUF945 family protein [Aliivibrio sp.]